jgi:hypothetical protein
MRTIGIDLALTEAHKAVVVNERGNVLTTVLRVTTDKERLDRGGGFVLGCRQRGPPEYGISS